MNICVIGRALPEKKTGLHGIFEFEQAVALHKAGHLVYYVYCDVRSIRYQHIFKLVNKDVNGVNVIGYNLPLGGIPHSILEKVKAIYLRKAINKMLQAIGRMDICHIHFPLLSIDTNNLTYLHTTGAPIVVTEHWTKVQQKMISDIQAEQLRLTAEYSEKIICVSEELGQGVLSYLSDTDSREKVIIIPNMVNESFTPANLTHSHFTFLFAGRLEAVKKCDLLIEAFEKAFPNNSDKIYLLIAGNGSKRRELEQLKHSYNDNRIQLLGYIAREDMPELYRKCDIYVSASAVESFGVPFAEAWCCGKPIICADNAAVAPYVIEGQNGCLFQLNNVNDLSEKMRAMYKTKHEYNGHSISENARALFSSDAILSKLSQIYTSALKKYQLS